MVADDEVSGVDFRKSEVNTNCNEEVTCEYCQEMKDHLEVITEELKSAQLIIKLLQEEINTQHGENEVSRNHRNVAIKNKPNDRKHKVLILADSHMRGCTNIIADLLGNSYSVTGIIKPNARLFAITSSLKSETESLTQKDFVIICGDANDVAKNETTLGLRSLVKFMESTNVIIMEVPHRYDLLSTSCVNIKVDSFNRKLKKILNRYKNLSIVNMAHNRYFFTLHGFHLNALGKKWISSELADSIRLLCATHKKTPSIHLPWKSEDSWINLRKNEDTRINKMQDGKMKMLQFQRESEFDHEVGNGINRQSDNITIMNIILVQENTFTETKSIPTPLNSPHKSKKQETQESNFDRIITQVKENGFKSPQTQDYEIKSTEDKDQDTRKLRKAPVKLNMEFYGLTKLKRK
jgi:hypothetical protein